MKNLIILLTLGLALPTTTRAAEPAKPLVTLSVKRQVLDSSHEMLGRQGNTKQKTYTLHVEIINTSSSEITDAQLTGEILVTRSSEMSEKLVKEPLDKITLATMKPNEKLTVDLGKITLREVEWRNRKFEEQLEEWKVDCVQKETVIGSAVSSPHFESLEKKAVTPQVANPGPMHPRLGRNPAHRLVK
ncbi:MAG: hypothetical protein ABI600_00030 [Luteolibacter sp.]